ncbi:hypothetical protein [Magnetospirillum aberrantis]|uniref:Uncharacterized protein n=1 Tax=Magnetospirillum aberrantis SpK TaxID=908842 RepID=A0A7C9QSY6_9PROT|nr:hypothetical protein [Magnetospirillum aberrantis]NFV79321.1 hypothetical protein [Magnetospirillum aberrantis SpK]
MEIGAIAGEKFAGLPSCGKGIAARERIEADLRRMALRHEAPWKLSANAIAVMDATCDQFSPRR